MKKESFTGSQSEAYEAGYIQGVEDGAQAIQLNDECERIYPQECVYCEMDGYNYEMRTPSSTAIDPEYDEVTCEHCHGNNVLDMTEYDIDEFLDHCKLTGAERLETKTKMLLQQ